MLSYLPAVISAIGAVLVVVGAFWSSIDAAKKNEQIAQSITGGDSYPIIDPSFVQGEDNTLLLMLITIGKYPIVIYRSLQ
ncbi:MAG: hypothetical protein WBX30_28355, partial [Stellaceae bacterium]